MRSRLAAFARRIGRVAGRDSLLAGDYGSGSIATADVAANAVTAAKLGTGAPCHSRNWVINGDMRISQRGGIEEPFSSSSWQTNADGNYVLDRWKLLSDGNDRVQVSRDTASSPSGSESSIRFTTTRGGGEQFGILQWMETRESMRLHKDADGVVSLSFKAKIGGASNLTSVRAMIIVYAVANAASREETHTADPVSTWQVDIASAQLATNHDVENAENFTVTTDWQTFKSEAIDLDTADTINIGVLLVSNVSAYNQGDTLWITDVALERGAIATDFVPRPIEFEEMLCWRFFETTYDSEVTPGQVAVSASAGNVDIHRNSVVMPGNGGNDHRVQHPWGVRKRISVTGVSSGHGRTEGQCYSGSNVTSSDGESEVGLTQAGTISTSSHDTSAKTANMTATIWESDWMACAAPSHSDFQNDCMMVHFVGDAEM